MRSDASRGWPGWVASLICAALATLLGLVAVLTVSGRAAAEGSGPSADESSSGSASATSSSASSSTSSSTSSPTSSATATSTATENATDSPSVPTSAFYVDAAQLRWGLSNEANNRAHAPGTFNFFSAGKLPNPGRGAQSVPQSSWKQRDGSVSIEKLIRTSDDDPGTYQAATWAGLGTTSRGVTLGAPGAGTYSNHQVVLSAGSGTVDPVAKTATITWRGSFTVIFYSGQSFFYVTDPVLTVVAGQATLRATLSGYGSSVDDTSQWVELAPRTVTLANLGVVDLSADLGFTATPAYAKVAVTVPPGETAQVRDGDAWGSFPQEFVTFQSAVGTASFWYTSGGATDAAKPALPVTISYDAGRPVPQPSVSADPTPATVTNSVRPAPSVPTVTVTAAPIPVQQAPSSALAVGPVPAASLGASRHRTPPAPVDTVFALAAAESAADTTDSSAVWAWSGGAIALLAALGLGLVGFAPAASSAAVSALRRVRRPRSAGPL